METDKSTPASYSRESLVYPCVRSAETIAVGYRCVRFPRNACRTHGENTLSASTQQLGRLRVRARFCARVCWRLGWVGLGYVGRAHGLTFSFEPIIPYEAFGLCTGKLHAKASTSRVHVRACFDHPCSCWKCPCLELFFVLLLIRHFLSCWRPESNGQHVQVPFCTHLLRLHGKKMQHEHFQGIIATGLPGSRSYQRLPQSNPHAISRGDRGKHSYY